MNIWKFLKDKMEVFNGKNALSYIGKALTYKELINAVEKTCTSLEKNTYNKQKICVDCDNPILETISILAVIASGNIAVPVNKKYGDVYINKIYEVLNPDLIITDSNYVVKDKNIIFNTKKNQNKTDKEIKDNTAFVMFTSGTTGIPKGVMLSHENIIENLKGICSYFNITFEDKILISRPRMHIAVLTGELLISLYKGLTIDFYPEVFIPQRLLKYINNNSITVYCGTPTIYYHIAKSLKPEDKTTLKKAVVSGERLSTLTGDLISERFSETDIYNVYGLTEASPRVSYLPPVLFKAKKGGVGIPLQGVNIRITDKDNNAVMQGDTGILWVKSPGIMQGYYKDNELTQKTIIDGWLKTGDMAYQDTNNYLYICGRSDNMIIRSGFNIYPQEIEDVLKLDKNISDCMVYGKDDERYGQKICAVIVPKEKDKINDKYIKNLCHIYLPPHMQINEITFTSKLDYTASGKVKRNIG